MTNEEMNRRRKEVDYLLNECVRLVRENSNSGDDVYWRVDCSNPYHRIIRIMRNGCQTQYSAVLRPGVKTYEESVSEMLEEIKSGIDQSRTIKRN